jgi:hypothetical protein
MKKITTENFRTINGNFKMEKVQENLSSLKKEWNLRVEEKREKN